MKRRNSPGSRRNPAEVLEQRALLTTFTVNSLADTPDAIPGDGVAEDVNGVVSLRAALDEANASAGADVIEFNDGSGPGVNFHDATPDTITLGGTQLEISSDLTINGPGADLLTVSGGWDGVANSGTGSRVFNITGGVVTIDSLTVADGNTSGAFGGGIINRGTLTLTNSTVAGNTAAAAAGAGADAGGGGIYNTGTVTLTNSTVAENTASGFGGGIYNDAGTVTLTNSTVAENTASGFGFGGGIYNDAGTLTLTNSTVAENTAGGGGGGGGGISNRGTVTLTNSTVAENTASSFGGILNVGTLTLTNSTVAGNTATVGGNTAGVGDSGGILNVGTLTLTNSTVAGNTADRDGGGITNLGALTLTNSTVAGNEAASNPDIDKRAGSLTASHSLIGVAGNSGLTDGDDGNIVGVDWKTVLENDGNDPLLADNGGPTQTIALLPGSAAINAGNNALAVDGDGNSLTTDQRGVGFNRVLGGTVDIGAVESPEEASLVVTTDQDVVNEFDGLTSLREALAFANSDPDFSEITFGDGTSLTGGTDFTDNTTPDTITLGGMQLEISSGLTITGPGADLLTVSGNDTSRVFNIRTGNHDVTFDSLTIADGFTNLNNAGRAFALSPAEL